MRYQQPAASNVNYSLTIKDEIIPILVRKRRGTKRITIRYQPLRQHLSLTLPPYVSLRQGLRFVEKKRDWIASQLKTHGGKRPLADGSDIPVLGRLLTLRHAQGRGVARAEGDVLLVPGDARFFARRVRDWL